MFQSNTYEICCIILVVYTLHLKHLIYTCIMLFFKAFVFTSQEFQITLNWLIPTTPSLRMIFLVMNQTPMKPVTPSQREQSNPRRHPLSLSAIPRHPLIWVHQWMMRTSYTTSCRMCWPKEMMQVRELVYYSAQIYQNLHTCCRCLNNSKTTLTYSVHV